MEKAETERVQRNGHRNTCWLPLYGPTFLLPGNSGSLQRLFSRTSPWERGEEGGKKKKGGETNKQKKIYHRLPLPPHIGSVSLAREAASASERVGWEEK